LGTLALKERLPDPAPMNRNDCQLKIDFERALQRGLLLPPGQLRASFFLLDLPVGLN
jgi:hypothetical protein